MRAVRSSKGLRVFYERVMGGQKSRKKIAVVAVARKLLSIIRAMLSSVLSFVCRLLVSTNRSLGR